MCSLSERKDTTKTRSKKNNSRKNIYLKATYPYHTTYYKKTSQHPTVVLSTPPSPSVFIPASVFTPRITPIQQSNTPPGP